MLMCVQHWSGAWSRGSALWHIYPEVAPALDYKVKGGEGDERCLVG